MLTTKKEIQDFLDGYKICNYTIREDLTVDVKGNVKFKEGSNIPKLPVKFGRVKGDFEISNCGLKTLEGCPVITKGFDCSDNQLTTLEFSPIQVNDFFYTKHNGLITVKGMPKVIKGDIDISYNKLTTLEGFTIETASGFNCQNNNLDTLENGPKFLQGNYSCHNNKLLNLKGIAEYINGSLNVKDNEINTLEFFPEQIYDNIDLSGNKLTTLKGIIKNVKGDFACSRNQITSLENGPETIEGSFEIEENELTTMEYCPNVQSNIQLSDNPLVSLKGLQKEVCGDLILLKSELKNLEGAPTIIQGDFYISSESLVSLQGLPSMIKEIFSLEASNLSENELFIFMDNIEIGQKIRFVNNTFKKFLEANKVTDDVVRFEFTNQPTLINNEIYISDLRTVLLKNKLEKGLDKDINNKAKRNKI